MLNFKRLLINPSLPTQFPIYIAGEKEAELLLNEKNNYQRRRVLIFAADEDIRQLYRTLLEIWHYEVEEAETVKQVITIADNKCFEAIIMDTVLDISGSLSVMKNLKENRELEKIPFILLSGHAQMAVRQLAIVSGASGFCIKPVDFNDLKNILQSCFMTITK